MAHHVRSWRLAKGGTHTSEVRVESIPDEVRTLILEMADRIAQITTDQVALKKELADLTALVAALGSVTGDELIKVRA